MGKQITYELPTGEISDVYLRVNGVENGTSTEMTVRFRAFSSRAGFLAGKAFRDDFVVTFPYDAKASPWPAAYAALASYTPNPLAEQHLASLQETLTAATAELAVAQQAVKAWTPPQSLPDALPGPDVTQPVDHANALIEMLRGEIAIARAAVAQNQTWKDAVAKSVDV